MASPCVLVVGDPNTVFAQAPVRHWRELGIDARILTSRWTGPDHVGDGLPVVAAETLAPSWARTLADGLMPVLAAASTLSLAHDPARVREALATWGPEATPPSLAPPIYDAVLIAAAADAIAPVCVLGQEVFTYGLATALCRAPRRALVVWGADVLHHARMSDVAHALVRQALHGVHYALANARPIEDVLHERFDVPRARIAAFNWGVDRRRFHRASDADARRLRARHGIPPEARIVMHIRRFLPHWGIAEAWPAMLAVAAARRDVHLVVLDGAPDRPHLAQALGEAAAQGLQRRITALPGHAPLDDVADLMSIADVSLSLVDSLEPLSWSVLQAAGSGSALVLADQATYRLEQARGLSAEFVPARRASEAAAAVLRVLDDPARRREMAAANDRYLAEHHDRDAQMARLLRISAGAAMADQLLRGTAACAGR